MIKCSYCLARYSSNYNHVCPPWLKELVKKDREKKIRPEIKLMVADGVNPPFGFLVTPDEYDYINIYLPRTPASIKPGGV
jgi:hypothetical protein